MKYFHLVKFRSWTQVFEIFAVFNPVPDTRSWCWPAAPPSKRRRTGQQLFYPRLATITLVILHKFPLSNPPSWIFPRNRSSRPSVSFIRSQVVKHQYYAMHLPPCLIKIWSYNTKSSLSTEIIHLLPKISDIGINFHAILFAYIAKNLTRSSETPSYRAQVFSTSFE
jgi:hypothetical protein